MIDWKDETAALREAGPVVLRRVGACGTPSSGGLWYSVEWGSLQAGVVITVIPCFVFYVLLQRYYVGGLQAGAVKG